MNTLRGKRHHGIARHERLHNSVARDLGIAIVTGRHRPGEILSGEVAASEGLRISRPAYREALKMLAAKGLVESRPKAGTRVCERARWNLLDPDVLDWMLSNAPERDFLDALFELRMIVEPAAAALAAERRSAAELATMTEALAEMAAHPIDSPAGQAADERFHATLFAASGNVLLKRLASIIAASVAFVAGYKRARQVPRDPLPDHEALLAAIGAGDAAGARTIVAALITHARDDTGAA